MIHNADEFLDAISKHKSDMGKEIPFKKSWLFQGLKVRRL
jgi:hypothetical protein